jgi:hypothetical protein
MSRRIFAIIDPFNNRVSDIVQGPILDPFEYTVSLEARTTVVDITALRGIDIPRIGQRYDFNTGRFIYADVEPPLIFYLVPNDANNPEVPTTNLYTVSDQERNFKLNLVNSDETGSLFPYEIEGVQRIALGNGAFVEYTVKGSQFIVLASRGAENNVDVYLDSKALRKAFEYHRIITPVPFRIVRTSESPIMSDYYLTDATGEVLESGSAVLTPTDEIDGGDWT